MPKGTRAVCRWGCAGNAIAKVVRVVKPQTRPAAGYVALTEGIGEGGHGGVEKAYPE